MVSISRAVTTGAWMGNWRTCSPPAHAISAIVLAWSWLICVSISTVPRCETRRLCGIFTTTLPLRRGSTCPAASHDTASAAASATERAASATGTSVDRDVEVDGGGARRLWRIKSPGVPAQFNLSQKLISIPPKLRGCHVLGDARCRVVLIVMREAQEDEVPGVAVRSVSVDVRDLPALPIKVEMEREADRATAAALSQDPSLRLG